MSTSSAVVIETRGTPSPLDYLEPAEARELEELGRAREATRALLAQHNAKLTEAEAGLTALARARLRDADGAARRFLGAKDAPAQEEPSMAALGRGELEAAVLGLRRMIAEDRAEMDRLQAALRARAVEALKAAMERMALEYEQAAVRTGELHAGIFGADCLLRAVTAFGTTRQGVLDPVHWATFYIPGSRQLTALRGKGAVMDPTFDVRVLAGGEPVHVRRSADHAVAGIRQQLRELCAGEDPFER